TPNGECRPKSGAFYESDRRVAIVALFHHREARARFERCVCRLLDDAERARRKPSALARRLQCAFAEAATIGRISEDKIKRRDRSRMTEAGRLATEYPGCAMEAEIPDVRTDQSACGG